MRKPSAETELKRSQRTVKQQADAMAHMRAELQATRGRATKAEQEAAEWKARFDALLARVPLNALKGEQ